MRKLKTPIVIAFTLKGQDFAKIKQKLIEIHNWHDVDDVVLLHGFMPREVIIEKGFSTEVVDALDQLFPTQINFYKDGPLRELMAKAAIALNANLYFVGQIKEGVAEEAKMYEDAKLITRTFALE